MPGVVQSAAFGEALLGGSGFTSALLLVADEATAGAAVVGGCKTRRRAEEGAYGQIPSRR